MKELNKILDQNEKILWDGTPSFWPFLFGSSIITTIFGLFWMLLLIDVIVLAIRDILFGTHTFGFAILLLPHFWVGIGLVFGIPLYKILVHKHTYYAITDKRVILQKGLVGRDFEIIDLEQITNAEVNVGVFDKLFGDNTGSILISSAGSLTYTRHGAAQRPYTLISIINPYDVFKFFKKVTHDVKTDIQYPNRLRPDENPGYRTEYH